MILLVAFCVIIVATLLRGGEVSRLGSVWLRHGWIAIVAFGLQAIVIYFPLRMAGGLGSPHTWLLLGSYVLLFIGIALNRHLPGLMVVGLGMFLNLTVMVANGGFMPVAPEALSAAGLGHLALGTESGSRLLATKDILLAREDTVLWFLSDIFVVPPSLPLPSIFSLGDIVVVLGVFWFFQAAMVPRSKTTIPVAVV
jgi:hypothetical protein